MPAIKTEALCYTYGKGLPGEVRALDNINIEIEKGEFVGIIGHTGSGKSTFIQTLNGLLRPQGKVYINGADIYESKQSLRQARFDVGLVFQYPEYQLFAETVFEDVAFGPRNMGLSAEDVEQRVNESLSFVGLGGDILQKSPFDLSGGQKRRAAIAGVLAMRPQILIMDEPASGLDPSGRADILGELKNYHKKTGGTVLLVSHSMDDIARYAKKVMVINEGALYSYDTVENTFAHALELEKMGLSVPQITKLFLLLRERGLDVPESVYTTEYAADSFVEMWQRRRG